MIAAVTSSEITLKGRNRRFFENALMRNIKASLASFSNTIVTKKGTSRFLIHFEGNEDEMREALGKIFGVDIISLVREVPLDIDAIKEAVLSHSDLAEKAIRVQTKRSDKKFPMTSQEINEVIGQALVDAGCTVDLKHPEKTVFIDILEHSALVSLKKVKGPGGLPVGTSGRVLSLLSGGIDSPVASWLMMKRGCAVDFLHLHSFEKDVKKSKVVRLAEKLREHSPKPMKIFLAPYSEFYKKTFSMDSKIELVLFRRFLLRLANRIAKRRKCKGIVMGDSIGQVASQTLDNILLTNDASALPVFRPLVAFNKEEIVDLAIRIGTYDTSIEAYKDCCSLVANKKPTTNMKLWEVKKQEEEIKEIVEKTFELCEIIEI